MCGATKCSTALLKRFFFFYFYYYSTMFVLICLKLWPVPNFYFSRVRERDGWVSLASKNTKFWLLESRFQFQSKETTEGWNTPKYSLNRYGSPEVHHWAIILRFLITKEKRKSRFNYKLNLKLNLNWIYD